MQSILFNHGLVLGHGAGVLLHVAGLLQQAEVGGAAAHGDLSALLGLYEDLSDFSCVEFSGKTFRYFVHKHNSSAQLFRGCYLTGDVIHDLFFRHRLSVLQNNNGGGKFTGVIVGKTCDTCVEDVGVLEQDGFQFSGSHLIAFVLNQRLQAVNDEEVFVFVPVSYVSRM